MAATSKTTARTTRPAPGDTIAAPCANLCTDAGFAAAFREHRARLVGIAQRRLGDREHAEDAVQETFVRAWRACGSFRGDEGPPLAAWLSVILRNVLVDMIRARAARPQTAWDGDPVDAADAASPIDAAVLRMDLLDALATVSEDHRGIVLRTVVHDRPYADVADELGVPVGTVKSRVYYALRGMRGALEAAA
ncbi:MAG: RNA polymerase sigma factor [Pseudonocardia sp.]